MIQVCQEYNVCISICNISLTVHPLWGPLTHHPIPEFVLWYQGKDIHAQKNISLAFSALSMTIN